MFGLFKPKWQHSDPEVRRQAVIALSDNSLLESLAREDVDLNVRKTAVSRIDDMSSLLKLRKIDALANTAETKLQSLITDHPERVRYTPDLGKYLSESKDTALLSHLAENNKDEQLQLSLLSEKSKPELILKACTEASNTATRLKAAHLLSDETTLRKALKELGKRDKKTSQVLRDKLYKLKQRQENLVTLEALTNQLDELGNNDNWKPDQARLELLLSRWELLSHIATPSHISRWEEALTGTRSRIEERKVEADTALPVIEDKQRLGELAEQFSKSLAEKLYLPASDAEEFTQTLNSFTSEWRDLPVLKPSAEEELAIPFNVSIEQCAKRIDELRKNARESRGFEKILDKVSSSLKRKTIADDSVNKLKKEWDDRPIPKDTMLAEKLQSDFNQRLDRLRVKLTKQTEQRVAGLLKIDDWLLTLQSDLEADKISSAGKLYSNIESLLPNIPAIPADKKRAINAVLLDCRPKLKHLEGWRHWGTDKARESLIDKATALAAAKLSTKNRLKSLKELRDHWKKLGKIDPRSARALWERFDTACNKAFEPVAESRKKEKEQREHNLVSRQAICTKLEAIAEETDWKAPDWREVDKTITQLRNKWRQTGPVKHTKWDRINKRFNTAMDDLGEHLENERRISVNRRKGLIDKMESIKDDEDLNQVLQTAKDLQKQWHPTVLSRRSEEQKLWKAFRTAADAIFARDKQRRVENNREMDELLSAKESICKQLEEIARLTGNELEKAHGQVAKLESTWEELGDSKNRRHHNIERRFKRAVDNIKTAQGNQLLNEKRARLESLLSGSCERPAEHKDPELLQTYLLEIEILLEIDSPEELADERMRLQVERLADNMGSSNQVSHTEEILALAEKACAQILAKTSLDHLDSRIQNILANSNKLT